MMASDLTDQALSDYHPSPWTSSHETRHPPHFDGVYIHTQHAQHHASSLVGGLPSPAPSGRAVSPPDCPKHDVLHVNGSWSPISPISPNSCEIIEVGLNHPLETPLHGPSIMASPSNATSLCGWNDINLPYNFDHTHWDFPTAYLAPDCLPGNFPVPVPWTGHIPPTNWPDGQLLGPDLAHIVPSTPPENLGQTRLNHPNPPPKPTPAPQPQQSPPKTELLVMHSPRSTNSSPSPDERSPSPPKQHHPSKSSSSSSGGPTLRTAPRRVKRPSPSAITKPGESPEHQRARATHNLVEEQYRRRLHARFEALLEVLPPEEILEQDGDGEWVGVRGRSSKSGSGSDGSGSSSGNGQRKRMSKVEVLNRAARVMRFLERNIERTRAEVEVLKREKEVAVKGARMSMVQRGHSGEGQGMGIIWAAAVS
ncbi:hypothetical protein C8A03DRAFT_16231 [Achaetomium macrosporum]|uniref:BHLH domain-containing protein n=1 Tax=Achaetomium macrosporum TaxID=79813 RepID=A0AAN7C903_9PEZI|nr:hypothetical protein C8A03DRAFT_16231 [Achaetomium macrosporum]